MVFALWATLVLSAFGGPPCPWTVASQAFERLERRRLERALEAWEAYRQVWSKDDARRSLPGRWIEKWRSWQKKWASKIRARPIKNAIGKIAIEKDPVVRELTELVPEIVTLRRELTLALKTERSGPLTDRLILRVTRARKLLARLEGRAFFGLNLKHDPFEALQEANTSVGLISRSLDLYFSDAFVRTLFQLRDEKVRFCVMGLANLERFGVEENENVVTIYTRSGEFRSGRLEQVSDDSVRISGGLFYGAISRSDIDWMVPGRLRGIPLSQWYIPSEWRADPAGGAVRVLRYEMGNDAQPLVSVERLGKPFARETIPLSQLRKWEVRYDVQPEVQARMQELPLILRRSLTPLEKFRVEAMMQNLLASTHRNPRVVILEKYKALRVLFPEGESGEIVFWDHYEDGRFGISESERAVIGDLEYRKALQENVTPESAPPLGNFEK